MLRIEPRVLYMLPSALPLSYICSSKYLWVGKSGNGASGAGPDSSFMWYWPGPSTPGPPFTWEMAKTSSDESLKDGDTSETHIVGWVRGCVNITEWVHELRWVQHHRRYNHVEPPPQTLSAMTVCERRTQGLGHSRCSLNLLHWGKLDCEAKWNRDPDQILVL
jgi:hypothetical protein